MKRLSELKGRESEGGRDMFLPHVLKTAALM